MKLTISLLSTLLPLAAFASDQQEVDASMESMESLTESSVDSSPAQEVRIAGTVKQDAERYLAGSEMSRLLKARLAELGTAHPELESDELVAYALDDAVAILTDADTGASLD